jgi:hypothetical protein
VESGVKYVKKNFLPLRDFRDLTDANDQLLDWVLGTAGNRLHGTTRERPLTRFESERSFLKSLPDLPPEPAVWVKHPLCGNCHVQFEKCFYSAPFRFTGEKLWVRGTAACVRILPRARARRRPPEAASPRLPPHGRRTCRRTPSPTSCAIPSGA